MNKFDKIETYAEMIIKYGLNVQEGQFVIIKAEVEVAAFARLVAKKAYEVGAGEVYINWKDDATTRLKFEHAADEVFDEVPKWVVEQSHYAIEKGACVLSIDSHNPDAMVGVDMNKMSRVERAMGPALDYYRSHLMSNKRAWCVAAYPSLAWAKKVFPELSNEDALLSLWRAIGSACRLDEENPLEAWKKHQTTLANQIHYLNEQQFDYLVYKNNLGTEVKVNLPKDHVWQGGSEKLEGKDYFFAANIPTEEVFTTACYDGVNGRIVSSKPLSYNGNMIEDFWFEFKEGRVVDFDAKVGKEALESLLNIDEGARHLGEVALVPHNSPISNSGILFYNTLFDENASCHFAVGQAYSTNIKGGANMSKEELKEKGLNDSITHVDFMIGTSDLSVVGVKKDGSECVIMREGNYTF